ncbi:cytosolic protein [Paenibacillus sp. YN15]|nr:cytosolic protein [Paenibacillus sp. YN15]
MTAANQLDFLYDITEETSTRFVSFVGPSVKRFDLAIISTARFFGKKLVADLQTGKTAILGPDDLKEEEYLEHIYQLATDEAEELRAFLSEIIGDISFTDI